MLDSLHFVRLSLLTVVKKSEGWRLGCLFNDGTDAVAQKERMFTRCINAHAPSRMREQRSLRFEGDWLASRRKDASQNGLE